MVGSGGELGDQAGDAAADDAVGEAELDPALPIAASRIRKRPRWSTPVTECQAMSYGSSHSTISIRPPTSAAPTRISSR